MAHEIFGDVANPSVRLGSQAWYTVPLSIGAHIVVFAALVIAPLMAADVIPSPHTIAVFRAEAELPQAPPPPPAQRAVSQRTPQATANPDAAPRDAPDAIAPEAERPPVPSPPGVVGGLDLPGTGFGTGPGVVISTPPPPPPAAAPQQPLRPGGNIRIPTKVHHVPPVYPVIAQQARVEGVVILEATIGTDGRVRDTRVLKSQPLLDQAAIDAVMKWRFTPTLLNGVPVPILMTVTVHFSLNR